MMYMGQSLRTLARGEHCLSFFNSHGYLELTGGSQ